ncbi:MAG: glycerol-3-phosphate acyltransferase, partial [Ignavibacteria bacterium]|nr:glycerol-3-phosphate acyltransferase [Ignavibacteria bacterium]
MNEIFSFTGLIVFVLCYLVGSFPTAYILVRLKSKKDITKEGSGNVGTLNSFEVSKSKRVLIAVLLIDILKGLLPAWILIYVMNVPFALVMLGMSGLIIGHNYPVWLKFTGGRGLATGTGIFLVINYFILIGWCVTWAVVFLFRRDVLIANTAATLSITVYVVLVNYISWMVV